MTHDRDIELVLDHWFADGPADMPDRVYQAVIDRVDRVPQRRLAQLRLRLLDMRQTLRLAAVAAVVLVVATIGFQIVNRAPAAGPGSSPTPMVATSPLPTLTPIPSIAADGSPVTGGLLQTWRSVGTRVVPSTLALAGFEELDFTATGLLIPDFKGEIQNTAAIAGTNQLVVGLQSGADANHWTCQVGDEGTYTFDVTQHGDHMTLTLISDPCPQRAAILPGTWVRQACPDPATNCLGNLDPGRYEAAYFRPFIFTDTADAAFTYEVPAGWENINPANGQFGLVPQGAAPRTGVFAFGDAAPASQDANCTQTLAPAVQQDSLSLATWLSQLPGLVATPPTPITVGIGPVATRLSGYRVDAVVRSTWTHACPGADTRPAVATFIDYGDPGVWTDRLVGTENATYFILDTGNPGNHPLIIEYLTPDATTFHARIVESLSIIYSLDFTPH